jgi:hypothetical protein
VVIAPWHASARLSSVVAPPCARGTMCSTDKRCVA